MANNPPCKSTLTIGLLWHSYFSGNLGVSALSIGNMTLIRDSARRHGFDTRFILFGPKGDEAFPEPEGFGPLQYVEASSVKNLGHYRKVLATCDLVCDIGSGDSLADIYGFKRFSKIAGLKFLVPDSRKRLVISPQTLGPFKNPFLRRIAARSMQNARLIMARDEPSLERGRAIVDARTAARIKLSTDVAFAMKPLAEWPDRFPKLDHNRTNIGLNVSGLLFQGGYSGDNQFDLTVDYPALIRRFIENSTQNMNRQIWLVPHVYSLSRDGIESDLQVAKTIAKEYAQVRLAPVFQSAPEAKTFIAAMDIQYSARMHAAIAAVSTGTACLPLSYSVKFRGLFAQLGYRHLVDLKSVSTNEAVAEMERSLGRIEQMAGDAAAAQDRAVQILSTYVDELDGIFAELAAA